MIGLASVLLTCLHSTESMKRLNVGLSCRLTAAFCGFGAEQAAERRYRSLAGAVLCSNGTAPQHSAANAGSVMLIAKGHLLAKKCIIYAQTR